MTPFILIPAAFISPCSKHPEILNCQVSHKSIPLFPPFFSVSRPSAQETTTSLAELIEGEQGDEVHGMGWREEREGGSDIFIISKKVILNKNRIWTEKNDFIIHPQLLV